VAGGEEARRWQEGKKRGGGRSPGEKGGEDTERDLGKEMSLMVFSGNVTPRKYWEPPHLLQPSSNRARFYSSKYEYIREANN